MMTTTTAPSLRWSSVRDCPRKAIYEATNAPARDRTDREQRILFRGKRLGRDYADFLAAKYGEDQLERERKVVWPLGVGHIDVFLKPTATAIEVLSSAHAGEQMIQSKLLQLVGYMEHDPAVENGCLIILDPSDFTEDRIPVSKTSGQYSDLVEEMHARIAQVQEWKLAGDIPGRVCDKPSEARSHFCLHAEHCFTDWEAPPVEEIAASDDLKIATASFDSITKALRDIRSQERRLKEHQDEAKAVLAAAELPVGLVKVGPYEVKRSHTQRQPSFEWRRAELAGVFDPEPVAQFFKAGAAYDTFEVTHVGGDTINVATDEDVPF